MEKFARRCEVVERSLGLMERAIEEMKETRETLQTVVLGSEEQGGLL